MIIWITGLSASGKTSIGQAVYRLWKPRTPNLLVIDGDEVRAILKSDSPSRDYTMEARYRVAERYCSMCAWLDRQDINVVCCTISFFEDLRLRNRRDLSGYFEVFIDTPMDKLRQRDKKNMYERAFRGELSDVVGVDIHLDPPANPDMVVDNSADTDDLEPIAKQVLGRALGTG